MSSVIVQATSMHDTSTAYFVEFLPAGRGAAGVNDTKSLLATEAQQDMKGRQVLPGRFPADVDWKLVTLF